MTKKGKALDKQILFRYSTYMGRKLNLIQVERGLKDKGFKIFTPFEFARIFETSSVSAQKFLERYTKKGIFARVKKGLYIFNFEPPNEMVLANRIYFPSYISFETALSYYGLIPETVYSLTSATTKPTREFFLGEMAFSYSKIKKEAFTGYIPQDLDGETALMATPEKAFCDYLYFVNLGKKSLNDRLKVAKLDFVKIKKYAQLFKRKGLERIVDDFARRT